MTNDPIDDMKKFKQILNEHYSGITQSLPEALAAVAGDVIGVDEDDLGPVADDVVSEENLNEADNKQEFVSKFTTIRNNAIAMSKGQKVQINVPNKVRNELWHFLTWMESTYGNNYANQVWDHFDLGELRKASAKYEMAGSPAPTEEYLDDVTSTFGVLIKYVQKMKDPAPAQQTQ
jgi:hypothetical protein